MIFSLENKIAVITGGGSGIGRAIALCFAQQGATICLIDLDKSNVLSTCEVITNSGGKAKAFVCNVSNQPEVDATIQEIIAAFKVIDILVNSAGIAHIGTLETTTEADFERIFRVNVKGTYNAMHAIIPKMKSQKKGVILNMASVAATLGIPERFAYSMSKGATLSMTISVATDFINDGIRCNCISPARVHTPFVDGFVKANYPGREDEMMARLSKAQPIGRMGTPEEVAFLALYLCSDEASFITGCDYPIDGGLTKLK